MYACLVSGRFNGFDRQGNEMKNIIILIALVLGFSAIAEAKVKLKKFDMMKTADGKLQFCKESSDYYQPGTYTVHAIDHEIIEDSVNSKTLVIGRKCRQYQGPNNSTLYVWRELDLFTDYNFEILRYVDSDFTAEYVTVKSEDHKLVVADRSFNTVAEVDLTEAYWGVGEAQFSVDLKKGILPENTDQFENGKVVSSVFFVYVRTKRTQTYSWNDNVDRFLHTGPAYSFIYFIQKQ